MRSAEEVRALVEEVGGFEAADGDAVQAALDMVPSEAAFYVPGAVMELSPSSSSTCGGGGDDSSGGGVVECEDEILEVDWSRVHNSK